MQKLGFVQVHRAFIHSDIWREASPALRSVIITLLSQADYKTDQVLTSSRILAKECRIRRMTLLRCLSELQEKGLILLVASKAGLNITVGLQLDHLPTKEWSKTEPTTGSQLVHSGSPIRPLRSNPEPTHIERKETNKKEEVFSKVLNEELPYLRDRFPFREREGLKHHLMARGYSEHQATLYMESFYEEYARKAVTV